MTISLTVFLRAPTSCASMRASSAHATSSIAVKAPISCRPQKKKRQGQENADEDVAGHRDPAVRQPPLRAPTPCPSAPTTRVLAFNAGGSTDLTARVLAHHLRSTRCQNPIVENKGG